MLVDDLYDKKLDNFSDPVIERLICLLREAINDWPTQVTTVEEYIRDVKLFLSGQGITIDAIERKLSNVSLNEAWQIESLTSLLELLKISKHETFESVLEAIVQALPD